ncbi:MAG: hypothetical protein NTZ39_09415 [Methanoregula sp.]|nr:hypothetical protein [Methanoregula sp.]
MDSRVPVISIVFLLLLIITAAGCISSNVNANTSVTSTNPGNSAATSPVPTQGAAPVATILAPTVPPVSYTSTPVPAVSFKRSEINQRFLDIAFGNENSFLNRWSDRLVKVSISDDYTKEDISNLNDFITRFNNVSATSKLSQVMEGMNEDITIRLVPASYLNTIQDDESNKIYRDWDTGEILFIGRTLKNQYEPQDTLSINSRFTGEERKYLILRCLLYELGFEGYSGEPNSFFYYRPINKNISTTDWMAINMMYSKRFNYGDSFKLVKDNLSV